MHPQCKNMKSARKTVTTSIAFCWWTMKEPFSAHCPPTEHKCVRVYLNCIAGAAFKALGGILRGQLQKKTIKSKNFDFTAFSFLSIVETVLRIRFFQFPTLFQVRFFQLIPYTNRNTYGRICTTDQTDHHREYKITNGSSTENKEAKNHDDRCNRCINGSG